MQVSPDWTSVIRRRRILFQSLQYIHPWQLEVVAIYIGNDSIYHASGLEQMGGGELLCGYTCAGTPVWGICKCQL